MYIGNNKYLFSLDVETDNLYGDIFAVGVTVWNIKTRKIVEIFGSYAELDKVESQWCKDNIIPLLQDSSKDFLKVRNRKLMRNMFWDKYIKWKDKSIILADFQYPCEANFFRKCVLDDLKEREWLGPYPIVDLGTMLLCAGLDPDLDRFVYTNSEILDKHNPIHDSIVSAKAFFKIQDTLNSN